MVRSATDSLKSIHGESDESDSLASAGVKIISHCIILTGSSGFSGETNMDALISALAVRSMLAAGCNMLIYRKRNQRIPSWINSAPSDLQNQTCCCLEDYNLLFFITVLRSQHMFADGVPVLPTGFCMTSHSLKQVLDCFVVADMFYMVSMCVTYLSAIPTPKDECSRCVFSWDRVCFGFLVLLCGEPNLFYKQTLFYITETCVLTFLPRPFIYFLIQFPLWVTLLS